MSGQLLLSQAPIAAIEMASNLLVGVPRGVGHPAVSPLPAPDAAAVMGTLLLPSAATGSVTFVANGPIRATRLGLPWRHRSTSTTASVTTIFGIVARGFGGVADTLQDTQSAPARAVAMSHLEVAGWPPGAGPERTSWSISRGATGFSPVAAPEGDVASCPVTGSAHGTD